MDGLALSISVGLQYGVPPKALVDKLINTRFEPSGFTENPGIRYPSSVLDYIARWLGAKFLSSEYLKPKAVSSDQKWICVHNFKGLRSAAACRRLSRRCQGTALRRRSRGWRIIFLWWTKRPT